MAYEQYDFSFLSDLGAIELLNALRTLRQGESREIDLQEILVPDILRDILRADGFDLARTITVRRAPAPAIDAYDFEQLEDEGVYEGAA